MSTVSDPVVEQLASFGLNKFRKGQRDVIDAVLRGDDCLCIMPTGGGKSLCYQLPSLARQGTTLVVSPLIALMKDQVDALQRLNIRATYINSSLDGSTQRERMESFAQGQYDLLYVAPERLRNVAFLDAVRQTRVQLLAIDEAHCISEWGHDFRPDYARIGRFRKRIGDPQTIALTATATVTVRQDIVDVLDLKQPSIFVSGFARDNLNLCVESPATISAKDDRLVEYLKRMPGAGIVYATTRKGCEHLVEILSDELDRPVAYYHAGMDAHQRRQIQEQFMSGQIPIVVATNAFGMGIDRADLRFVVHYNLPGSLEAYYQEAGRAGRDGLPSQCMLLYTYQDRFIQEFFIENAYPSREIVKQVYEYLRSIEHDPIELTLQEIKDDIGVSIGTEGIAVAENLLEKAGILERLQTQQNMASIKIDSELPTLVDLLPRDAKTRRKILRALESIVGSMRGERVFFHPTRLSSMTQMKWEAVVRGLRELNKLDAVDYVAPFRGRAVHVIRRDLPFDQIKIDFKELERRKAAEYERLERVVSFAHARNCRQRVILDYFGDPEKKQCGRCDNCDPGQRTFSVDADTASRPVAKIEPTNSPAKDVEHQSKNNGALYAMQVALSGAARASGRVGKGLLAQMLAGSTAKKVKQSGLQSLPTFGKLKPLKLTTVTELLDKLLEARLIQQTEKQRFRPLLSITDHGRDIMTGKENISVARVLGKETVTYLNSTFGHCEPTVVSTQTKPTETLVDNRRTNNDWSGEESESFTANFVDEPDDLFERIDDAHSTNEKAASPNATDKDNHKTTAQPENTDQQKDIERPSFFWTWKLFADGFSFAQVRQIRRLDHATLNAHLQQARHNEYEVDDQWFVID